MTNGDWVRNMNDEQLAFFINIGRPNCNEICEDAKSGCAFGCKHHCGEDILRDWLKKEVGVSS